MLQGVPEGYKEVRRDNRRLQRIARGYMVLRRVTWGFKGYRGVKEVTWGSLELQGVSRGFKGLQKVAWG